MNTPPLTSLLYSSDSDPKTELVNRWTMRDNSILIFIVVWRPFRPCQNHVSSPSIVMTTKRGTLYSWISIYSPLDPPPS